MLTVVIINLFYIIKLFSSLAVPNSLTKNIQLSVTLSYIMFLYAIMLLAQKKPVSSQNYSDRSRNIFDETRNLTFTSTNNSMFKGTLTLTSSFLIQKYDAEVLFVLYSTGL